MANGSEELVTQESSAYHGYDVGPDPEHRRYPALPLDGPNEEYLRAESYNTTNNTPILEEDIAEKTTDIPKVKTSVSPAVNLADVKRPSSSREASYTHFDGDSTALFVTPGNYSSTGMDLSTAYNDTGYIPVRGKKSRGYRLKPSWHTDKVTEPNTVAGGPVAKSPIEALRKKTAVAQIFPTGRVDKNLRRKTAMAQIFPTTVATGRDRVLDGPEAKSESKSPGEKAIATVPKNALPLERAPLPPAKIKTEGTGLDE